LSEERKIPHRTVRIARIAYEACRALLQEEEGKETLKPFDQASPQQRETIVNHVSAALGKPTLNEAQVWEHMRANRGSQGPAFHELDTVPKLRAALIVDICRRLGGHYT
jgi:hypothetical protein